ncbi:MAG TPA: integrase core domain-containing protein [Campylobacterales bacterium]|nr:integrase core domain-containing protein [Campylobacterales bacterium]
MLTSGNHKFDIECKKDDIEHRLTAPATPKTNGMVERANGTIKNSTIKAQEYKNIEELKADLNRFLMYYNTNRRHGGPTKELKVRTPYEAVKSWFEIEPEIFKISPDAFYTIALNGMV